MVWHLAVSVGSVPALRQLEPGCAPGRIPQSAYLWCCLGVAWRSELPRTPSRRSSRNYPSTHSSPTKFVLLRPGGALGRTLHCLSADNTGCPFRGDRPHPRAHVRAAGGERGGGGE